MLVTLLSVPTAVIVNDSDVLAAALERTTVPSDALDVTDKLYCFPVESVAYTFDTVVGFVFEENAYTNVTGIDGGDVRAFCEKTLSVGTVVVVPCVYAAAPLGAAKRNELIVIGCVLAGFRIRNHQMKNPIAPTTITDNKTMSKILSLLMRVFSTFF